VAAVSQPRRGHSLTLALRSGVVAGPEALDYVAAGWSARFERAFAEELRTISGARPGSRRGDAVLTAAVRCAEALIGSILRDISDPQSDLYLAVSRICDPRVVEDAARAAGLAVNEGAARGKKSLVAAALFALGGFLGGLAQAATEGGTSAVVENVLTEEQKGDADDVLTEVIESCHALSIAVWPDPLHAKLRALQDQVDALEEQLKARKFVDRAKGRLMDEYGMSENDAFAYIQRRAINQRVTMKVIAEQVIMGDLRP
jgi:hypothetical protein